MHLSALHFYTGIVYRKVHNINSKLQYNNICIDYYVIKTQHGDMSDTRLRIDGVSLHWRGFYDNVPT